MYKCEICQAMSNPGEPRRVHTIYRQVPCLRKTIVASGDCHLAQSERQEIEREIPVCQACQHLLNQGKTMAEVTGLRKPKPKQLPSLYYVDKPVRRGQPLIRPKLDHEERDHAS